MHIVRNALAIALSCLASAQSLAQQPVVRAELDSMNILVGGQVGLNVTVSVAKGVECHVLQLPDTLSAQVEVVEAQKPDTIENGDLTEYVRRYMVTSFDTGLHYVGPIPVAVTNDSLRLYTPEFALSVMNPFQNMAVNQEGVNVIYDINSAEDAPFQWRELLYYWPWALAAVILAGLVYLGIFLWKKYGRKKTETEKKAELPSEPCEVTALRDLERIRSEKRWMRNQVKEFYTDLTETLRKYLSSRYDIQTKESTSAEIMSQLKLIMRDEREEADRLAEILELADLVKFAKMEPLADENDKAIADAELFVNNTTEAAKRKEAERKTSESEPPVSVTINETEKENA